MKENVVHITVGVLFDLYVKDLIKKETYDDCIRAYKEYLSKKKSVDVGKVMHGPSVDIEFYKKQYGDKWREGIVGKVSISKESVDAIINDIVEQIKVWRDNNLPKHTIDGIDYDELNQLVRILHDYNFMSASMFRDLTKVLQENKELHECYEWYAEQDMFIRNKY